MLMNEADNPLPTTHFAILNEKYKDHALLAYKLLTDNQISVYWNYKYNLKKSLTKSSDSKASFLIIIGEEEYNNKKFSVKNLNNGNQKLLNLNEIINFITND